MPGREPMNAGHRLIRSRARSRWVRKTSLTAAERLRLLAVYRGLSPLAYGRYGIRRRAAVLPGTRVVVKDPFALLSLPAVVSATRAVPILVYRHPGAVLSSYRRMGWTADLEEVNALLGICSADPPRTDDNEAADMARFWVALNAQALDDLDELPEGFVVSHAELTAGGPRAMRRLLELCNLRWPEQPVDQQRHASTFRHHMRADTHALHRFGRSREVVARGWQAGVTSSEVTLLEAVAGGLLDRLEAQQVRLT